MAHQLISDTRLYMMIKSVGIIDELLIAFSYAAIKART